MKMILRNLAKIYSVCFVIFSIFIGKLELSKRQIIILWWLFVLSLSIMTYNMTPNYGYWDIQSHFAYFDQIRNFEISFFDFLFNNRNFVGGYEYRDLIFFNILRYIGVHLSDNNYVMPTICVFIDYSILGYIVIDWKYENKETYNLNLLTLLLCFAFTPLIHASSGMRNVLCAYIMGLAVYLYLYKKKSIVVFIVLFFMAVTIHPAAIITVPFVFLAKMNLGTLAYLAILIISLIAKPFAERFRYSSFHFLALICRKFLSYTSDTQYRASRAPLYGVLAVTAIFLIIYFILYRRFNESNDPRKKTIYNFLAIYMVYIWGNIGNYDMILRPAYVIGTLSPILVSFLTDKNIWSNKGLRGKEEKIASTCVMFSCLILCGYVNYKFFHHLIVLY